MRPGVVEIVNMALARIGENPIQSLEEGTVPANMAKMFYDPARRSALRDYVWNFALSVKSLAQLDEDGGDFSCVYALPADCLKILRLRGGNDFRERGHVFTVRGGKLYANVSPAKLEYVRDESDPSKFDDKFVEALSYKLASDLAVPVKGSTDLMANFMNVYTAKLGQAATLSAEEERNVLSENPYMEARLHGPY